MPHDTTYIVVAVLQPFLTVSLSLPVSIPLSQWYGINRAVQLFLTNILSDGNSVKSRTMLFSFRNIEDRTRCEISFEPAATRKFRRNPREHHRRRRVHRFVFHPKHVLIYVEALRELDISTQ